MVSDRHQYVACSHVLAPTASIPCGRLQGRSRKIRSRAPPAFSSSDFRVGQTVTKDPVTGGEESIAVCRLFLGPRGSVEEGKFLLQIRDVGGEHAGEVLELRGTVVTEADGSVRLAADEAAAEDFYQQILEKKLHLSSSEFDLRRLLAHVGRTESDIGDTTITCGVRVLGFLREDPRHPSGKPVHLVFGGPGLMFEGLEAQDAASVAELAAPAQTVCQKPNFAPEPSFCPTPGCLITFKNYKWWTEYGYFADNAPPCGDQGCSGFWNLNNVWSPRNVELQADGLHLFVRQQQTPDETGHCCVTKWTAGEAVTALNLDDSLAKLGYGTYLVAAKVLSAPTWGELDTNVAFGAFTYERLKTGDTNNPYRELDLAEISRWGRVGADCRIQPPVLCEGNAQFALQLWDDNKGNTQLPNVNRYTIGNTNEITLVMIWTGAQQPVTFRQYNGLHTLDMLPATPANEWTQGGSDGGKTPTGRNAWVPADGCQQFHLNLWMGNFSEAVKGINPPPASVQEIVVTNFEYKP